MTPKPGNKIRVIKTCNQCYYKNEIYTLHFKYMDNGVWKKYNVGWSDSDGRENMWETEEHMGHGIQEKWFEVIE